jgi:hypothetical protein
MAFCPSFVRADPPLSVHVGCAMVKNAACPKAALKTIQLMEKEHFLYGKMDDAGAVQGWSEKAALAVVALPNRDDAFFLIIAASSDAAEAERLRNLFRTHLMEAPAAPDKTPKQIGTLNPAQKAKVPAIRWQIKQRGLVRTIQYFQGGACIVLEKEGIMVSTSESGFAFGTGQNCLAGAFSAQGPSALTVQLGAFAVSWDEANSLQRAKSICQAVVKLMCD